jgi:PqqD family protein of HPr-rel-A system
MWRLVPGQSLRFRQFDDEFVVYNDLSGDTHLLGDSAAHLLSVLQQGPAASAALLDSLAAAHGAVLNQLSSLFLIEALPC